MNTPGDIGPTASDDDGRESEPPLRLCFDTLVEAGDWSGIEDPGALVVRVASVIAALPELASHIGQGATACIAFSSDAEVRALNARFRAMDKPTNVLSFPSVPLPPGLMDARAPRHLGDIVLAAETIAAEAGEQGIPLAHHVQHLVIHGVLHLVGHDHETDDEAKAMESLETRLLAMLGIADPYRSNE